MMDDAKCYVAMHDHGAFAACVIDGNTPAMVERFVRQHRSANLKIVTVQEARRLLGTYIQWKKSKRQT